VESYANEIVSISSVVCINVTDRQTDRPRNGTVGEAELCRVTGRLMIGASDTARFLALHETYLFIYACSPRLWVEFQALLCSPMDFVQFISIEAQAD